MPSALSPAAKSKVAAAIAVVMAAVTAWQIATGDGFTWLDIIPVVGAVGGTIATDLIPNSPGQPVAKAIAHGVCAAISAATTAVAAFTASDPSGVTAVKLLVVGGGAVLVWYMPEAAGAVKVIDGELDDPHGDGLDIVDAIAKAKAGELADAVKIAAGDVAASMGPDLPAAGPSEPTPVGDAAAQAAAIAHASTAPQPVLTPTA